MLAVCKDSESDSGGRSRKVGRKRQARSSSSDSDSNYDVAQRLKELVAQGVISGEDSRRLLTMSELERETEIVRIRDQLEQKAHQYCSFNLSHSFTSDHHESIILRMIITKIKLVEWRFVRGSIKKRVKRNVASGPDAQLLLLRNATNRTSHAPAVPLQPPPLQS